MTVTSHKYRVVLHDDDEHTAAEVVELLVKVARMGEIDAKIVTHSVHKEGMAPIKLTHLEHAEFVAEQLTRRGYTAHIERADDT